MNLRENLFNSVQQRGEAEAYTYLGKTSSYTELGQQVARLAGKLRELGVKEDCSVALILPNSAEFLITYYAVVSLGARVIPINPLYTRDEIGYILMDSQSVGVVTLPQIAAALLEYRAYLPHLSWVIACGEKVEGAISWAEALEAVPLTSWPELHEDDVAVILYTSGTTGKPKGAMLTHKNLCSNAESLRHYVRATSDDRFVVVLPMFHVFCMTVCMNMAVLIGSPMYILPKFSPAEVVNVIRDWQATVFAGVPTMYNFIMQIPNARPEDFRSLRLAISGGASLPVELLRNFEAKFRTIILEGYGLSEASPVVSFNPIDGARKPGSIGLTIPGVEVKIVDDNDRELPAGEVGELVVKGPNVMAGYFNNPAATAEALRNGWLHTGDLARRDEEGYLYIVDRKKDMVIVGGYNVYPREVEEVLYQIPQVLEAAVIGVPDPDYGEAVVAFVATKAGQTLTEEEVLEHCRQHLAKYKVPAKIIITPELPKNSTGKILRRVLKEQLGA
ncbi:MAG: long-chain-fatty-acid--CoA ligase [Bacillota bacterium]